MRHLFQRLFEALLAVGAAIAIGCITGSQPGACVVADVVQTSDDGRSQSSSSSTRRRGAALELLAMLLRQAGLLQETRFEVNLGGFLIYHSIEAMQRLAMRGYPGA